MNITLPTPLAEKVKAAPNRSALIAESLREKFQREEKKQLTKLLATSYADASKEDQQINQDWDVTTGDGL